MPYPAVVGDLFLELDNLLIAGMAAFAGAHICFIRFFISRSAIDQLKRKPWILAIHGVVRFRGSMLRTTTSGYAH